MKYNKGAILRSIEQPSMRDDVPDFDTGDTVRVDYKVVEGNRSRIQAFEGVVIARKNGKGARSSVTVRKVSFGEGVERIFPIHSPLIDKIVVVRRGRTRRAKLYYLRNLRGKKARLRTDTARQEMDRAAARAARDAEANGKAAKAGAEAGEEAKGSSKAKGKKAKTS
jgi:large subunit ribosomal protein L19